MRFLLVGEITYQANPEGRVLSCLEHLLAHIPPHKITLLAPNLQTNWEYKGVRVLPLHSPQGIQKYQQIIQEASIGLVYANQMELAKELMKLHPHCLWIVDAHSEEWVNETKHHLPTSYAYKFNRKQAEIFSSLSIHRLEDMRLSRDMMRSKGIRRAWITLNKEGVYYFDEQQDGIILSETITRRQIKDAGDAFVAGVLYGLTFSRNVAFLAKKGIEFSALHINRILKQFFTFGRYFEDSE